jgi:hypothetical protein
VGGQERHLSAPGAEQVAQSGWQATHAVPTRSVFAGQAATQVPLNTGPTGQEVQCAAVPAQVEQLASQGSQVPLVAFEEGKNVPAAQALTQVVACRR